MGCPRGLGLLVAVEASRPLLAQSCSPSVLDKCPCLRRLVSVLWQGSLQKPRHRPEPGQKLAGITQKLPVSSAPLSSLGMPQLRTVATRVRRRKRPQGPGLPRLPDTGRNRVLSVAFTAAQAVCCSPHHAPAQAASSAHPATHESASNTDACAKEADPRRRADESGNRSCCRQAPRLGRKYTSR